jgi:hypothetical protein
VRCWRHRCSSGRVDTSRTLSKQGAVCTNGRAYVHSLQMASPHSMFSGWLKSCPPWYILPCSFFSRASLFICSSSTTQCSTQCFVGWHFCRRYTHTSRLCQFFGSTARTTCRCPQQLGSFMFVFRMLSLKSCTASCCVSTPSRPSVPFGNGCYSSVDGRFRASGGKSKQPFPNSRRRSIPVSCGGQSTIYAEMTSWKKSLKPFPASSNRMRSRYFAIELKSQLMMRWVISCATLSSNSVPKAIKITRLTTCLNATSGARPAHVFDPLIYVNWGGGLDSVDIGHSLRSWDKASKGRFTPYIRGVVAIIVASVSKRDETWTTLASDHLGLDVEDDVFQDYLKHGDSVLLANLIHFMRHADRSKFFALGIVVSLSEFDPRNTLPELQRDFCALWNQVVQEAQDGGVYSCPVYLLREIRHHYVALHQVVDASGGNLYFSGPLVDPSSYPLCNVPGHPSQPTHSIEPAHPPATTFSIPSPSSSPQSWPVPITRHFLDDTLLRRSVVR